ncbi:TIGR03862 family flavoprotein [Inhella gelatinilytica]|uniref:TIGR03862 family flavoprotein n=1 Tax=Inhella gelatinilytica TaxID=2795030 RepID=A0A931IWM0_9BURK|nr:TIGR03862 family flavoprotein [Inhella gelatinilytica]MBH9552389.1 TIGR03862 family flavoprotein [Inhella gelatinilytica]
MQCPSPHSAVVIGGGPAGLAAAEVLSAAGWTVDLFDAMPSVGRKFLLAGRGGLNLTHSEPFERFLSRFGARAQPLHPALEAFGPDALRAWAADLGISTFVGTSGRVFPTDMKAAPLLRAWLHRLREQGVRFHMRHRWRGWTDTGDLRFDTPAGPVEWPAQPTLLALGGASWARLGSDGAWVPWLAARGVAVAPLQPANCGFDVQGGWSDYLVQHHAGQPIKPVRLAFQGFDQQGEFVLTATGIEGSLVYAASRPLREALARDGTATLHLDLLPQTPPEKVRSLLHRGVGSKSFASFLKSQFKLQGLKTALLHEVLGPAVKDPTRLAEALKALPLTLVRTRPIDEAISTAGGVAWAALDEGYQLKSCPRIFVAGEMLDWEAPTGGYLLTASLATGRAAAAGLMRACA